MTTCHDTYTLDELVPPPLPTEQRIVVGVDGSPASMAALRWAARQATCSGGSLEVVEVYEPVSEIAFAFGGYPAVSPVDPAEVRASALVSLRTAVQTLDEEPEGLRLIAIADGSPSHALTRAARGASMLVVGAHNRHGLGLLLGSTASSCVRHAVCPVVVVPATIAGG